MILLVGLGNPTPDSNDNRHNIGFKIIDAINQKFSLSKPSWLISLRRKGILVLTPRTLNSLSALFILTFASKGVWPFAETFTRSES